MVTPPSLWKKGLLIFLLLPCKISSQSYMEVPKRAA